MGDIQLPSTKDEFHDMLIHLCFRIPNPLPSSSYTREGRTQVSEKTTGIRHTRNSCISTSCQVWYKEAVDQTVCFIGLDQALHDHPRRTQTRLYTQGNNGDQTVSRPVASHFPVGNVSVAHSVGEPHNFTTRKYFSWLCQSEIGYLDIFSVLFLCSCVRKGSIRDEIHLELHVLNRLEIGHKVLPHSLHAVRNQDQRYVWEWPNCTLLHMG